MNKLKRYVIFLIGLFVNSLGVSLITKASLGTSPISSIPYVLSLSFPFTLGNFTIFFSVFLILLQLLILRKNFKLEHVLQIPVSIVFGYFIDLTMLLFTWVNPQNYVMKIVYLLIGCLILGIGVYRGDVAAQKNPFYVMLYVSLFPQLVAGPIVRYKTVENEIAHRQIHMEDVADGLERFILGFAKKIIIANNVGALADKIFEMNSIDMPLAWLGAIAYTLQIYFDFSAYSDMAIGLGRVFGFHFEENFNFPYIAKSVGDFWRRWHISLTTWFRDYVYIPLGGNRKGMPRMYVNMFIIWTLTGIWHGAEWNFILWGMYYFVFQAIEKLFLGKWLAKIPRVFQHIYTMFVVTLGWVLFRCDSGLSQCVTWFKALFSGNVTSEGMSLLHMYAVQYGVYLVLGVILSMPIYRVLKAAVYKRIQKNRICKWACAAAGYAVLLALFYVSVLYLVNSTYNPFIYFRF